MAVYARQFTTPAGTQPRWFAALNRATQGVPICRANAAAWMRGAVDAAGVEPAPDVREAFEALVQSIEADAALGMIGRLAARKDSRRKLSQHLHARALVEAGQLEAPLDMPEPIYLLGWMRSGTTALHRLLAADPDNWWPHHYETMFCVPPRAEDDRAAKTAAVLAELKLYSPHYQAIHPMQPGNPEECVNLFTHVFRTPQFAVQYRVPSYLKWLAAQDASVAYGRYVEELGILRYHRGGGKRMVLKDPTHMGFLPALLERLPRAKFVFIHRDPVEVFSSMSSMYAYTRAIFTRDVDPRAIGPELFDDPLLGAHAQGLAVCDGLGPGRVAHVRHVDVRADPVAAARAIYETLGLPFSEAAEQGMRRHVARRPAAHHHEHTPNAFGLRPEAVRERLADYIERFDL